MAFKLPKIHVLIASGCLVLALIFQIVGIAGTGWVVFGDYGSGLFRACVLGYDGLRVATVCGSIDAYDDWFKAVQAFSILGLLAVLGAVAVGAFHFFKEDTTLLSLVAAILSGVAAFCMLIEFAVYAGELQLPASFGYGYGFILTIIACVLSVASAALFFVAKSTATQIM